MSFSKKDIKYPLFLFALILIAKIVYIFVESSYNYDVFTLTTSNEFSRESMENLNQRGHIIASIGFTLFFMPILYFFVKNLRAIKQTLYLSLFSVISFFLFYFSLNLFVDYIVKENRDKRYEAYYTNLIKYGMLNSVLTYNAFIPKDRMNQLDLSDKILLTNIFLLTREDKHLIEKFREKGEENAIEFFIREYKQDEYKKSFNDFKKLAYRVEEEWKKFHTEQLKVQNKLKSKIDEEKIKESFDKLNQELENKYINYKEAYANLNSEVVKSTTLQNLSLFKNKLDKYFRYQKYQKAKDKYKQEMIANFGHEVEPKSWLASSGIVSFSSISRNIKNQMALSIKERLLGLEQGLSKKEFLDSIEVKREVANQLKKEDILIPIEFDYSYKDFKKYYLIMLSKKYNGVDKEFEKKLTQKIGKNDLKLNYNWEEFIYSQYVGRQLKEQGIKEVKLYQDVLKTGDIGNFELMIYQPKAKEIAIEKIIFEKEEFYNNKEIAKKGDEAIKLLYIPPIALGLSLLALLLNLWTVIKMLLEFGGVKKSFRWLISASVILIIICMPKLFSTYNIDSKILEKKENSYILSFLEWSSYWIKVNYSLQKLGVKDE